jgi:uncharacterized protein (TIGR02246 family)
MSDPIAAVTQVVQAFSDCWNRHDMTAFARLFAPDAEFVNVVGLWWKGRDEIEKAHEFTHATMFRKSRLTIADLSIRFPLASIAIARSRWVLEGHVSPRMRHSLRAKESSSTCCSAVLRGGRSSTHRTPTSSKVNYRALSEMRRMVWSRTVTPNPFAPPDRLRPGFAGLRRRLGSNVGTQRRRV